MAAISRLELVLLALLIGLTIALAFLWRGGAVGGFVVLVSLSAFVIWAVWLGWRPRLALARGLSERAPDVAPVTVGDTR